MLPVLDHTPDAPKMRAVRARSISLRADAITMLMRVGVRGARKAGHAPICFRWVGYCVRVPPSMCVRYGGKAVCVSGLFSPFFRLYA